MTSSAKKGFTLIELLVVIAIVGLLASTILINLNAARQRGLKAKARAEISEIVRAAFLARIIKQTTLGNVTGNWCTACSSSQAVNVASLTNISNASGVPGVQNLTTDPWGGMYTLDENEGEMSSTDCRHDTIYATGEPDQSTFYNLEYFTPYCQQNPSGTSGWQITNI